MKMFSKIISVIFHPLWLAFLVVVMAFWIDRYAYYIADSRGLGAMMIINFAIMVIFPAISIAMLSGLNFISSIQMPKREDRIIPLIITLTLYIWYFVNVNHNSALPDSLRFVALGLCIAVGAAFFTNNFSKISLHAIGATGFATATGILIISTGVRHIYISLGVIGEYRVSAIFTLWGCIIICGLVGTARLYLRAHRPQEIYGGVLIGFLSQVIAYRIII